MWIIPPVALAVAAALAAVLVPAPAALPVVWSGAVSTVLVGAASAEAARRGRAVRRLRREYEAFQARTQHRFAVQEAETERLAKSVLPAAIERLHMGVVPQDITAQIAPNPALEPSFREAHETILYATLEAIATEESLRDHAQRAFVNIARRVQAIVHQQAMDLREMEGRHGNYPRFFNDILHIDHGNALIGRLADSVAVLGGSRPGRQWRRVIPLYNVLRGAMSRILDYRRVSLHSVADVGIVGPTVEPLIHAVAELLDNACRYSPPQSKVHLTAVEVQNGVAVEIEDAGVGLNDEPKRRVERTLRLAQSGTGIDLDDLTETPRLGLSVVGRIARDNDFTITMRPSAYGGTRAVVVVPAEAIAVTPAPGGEVARAEKLPPPRKVRFPSLNVDDSEPDPPEPLGGHKLVNPLVRRSADPEVQRNSKGLPQRHRKMPEVPTRRRASPPADGRAEPVPSSAPPGPDTADPGHGRQQPGIWLAAFTSAVNGEARETAAEPGAPAGSAHHHSTDGPSDDKDE